MYEIVGQKVYVDSINYTSKRCYVDIGHLKTETCFGTYYFPLSHVKKYNNFKYKLK